MTAIGDRLVVPLSAFSVKPLLGLGGPETSDGPIGRAEGSSCPGAFEVLGLRAHVLR